MPKQLYWRQADSEIIRKWSNGMFQALNSYFLILAGTEVYLQKAIDLGLKAENMDIVECVPEGSFLDQFSARIYVFVKNTFSLMKMENDSLMKPLSAMSSAKRLSHKATKDATQS